MKTNETKSLTARVLGFLLHDEIDDSDAKKSRKLMTRILGCFFAAVFFLFCVAYYHVDALWNAETWKGLSEGERARIVLENTLASLLYVGRPIVLTLAAMYAVKSFSTKRRNLENR